VALRYAIGIAIVLFIVGVREGLSSMLGQRHTYTLFFGGIAVTSWYCGFGPSILAILLSYFLANFLFSAPGAGFNLKTIGLENVIGQGGFLFSGLAVAFTSRALHMARRRAERKQLQLELEILERRCVQEKLEQAQAELRDHTATLEKKVEERTATLTETVQSLEGVCYHVAHDLRAPLRAMGGFTSLLLENYGPQLDASGRSYAARIVGAAARMDELIQDLLAYGRLGHVSLPLQRVELEDSLNLALDLLHDEIAASKAEILVQHPLHAVHANGVLLGRILTDLLSNSLKFLTPDVVPRIRIWSEAEPRKVRLSIQDNGIGIESQYHERIFRVFERLRQSEDIPGTGIGLAMVRKGVQRMKGRAGVVSAIGKGSCFWLELPLPSLKPS
jgi:signal transduction histidine kinase